MTADSPEILDRIPALLPPGAEPCAPDEASDSFGVLLEPGGSYRFERGDSPVTRGIDFEFAIQFLEGQLRMYVGLNAPEHIFIHAGVVAIRNRAIVMPGLSLSGKTSLVLALIQAGAVYYSDDYALLDRRGLVHPFPKPLSVRDQDQVQRDRPVNDYGAAVGETPIRIGSVIFTTYRPGAEWSPVRLSPGHGALAMFSNALAARQRSEETLRVISRAIEGAVLLEGHRGEAGEIVAELLATVAADEVPRSSV